MSYGLGSDDNPHLLVLADDKMNGRKKSIFAGDDINAANEPTNQATRRAQRSVSYRLDAVAERVSKQFFLSQYAGVFYYMRRDEIWDKFTETSQHMELVLAEFDEQYPWTRSGHINTGQPKLPIRTAGQPTAGLRDLYCFWIESLLTNIEKSASGWLTATTANYKSAFGGEPAGKKWLDNVLHSGGLISESILTFPKAAFTHKAPNPLQPDIWTQSNFKELWDEGKGAAGPF
jgi:chitinase